MIETRGRCGAERIDNDCEDARRDGPDLPNLGPEFDSVRGTHYIPDSRFLSMPFAGNETEEAGKWRVCPTSETRRVLPIIHLWRRHKSGVEPIDRAVGVPSAALLEAFEVLANVEVELDNAHQKLVLDRLKAGG